MSQSEIRMITEQVRKAKSMGEIYSILFPRLCRWIIIY